MATNRSVPLLTCTHCGSAQREGQHFCGDCGHKLETICTGCDSANPPTYKFCGHCGKNLALSGALTLDRTGLIENLDKTAMTILKPAGDRLLGKPFSIFVNTADRAYFYSCWNIALNSSQQQDLEVELKRHQDSYITTHLILKPFSKTGKTVDSIQMQLEDITDNRRALEKLEEKQKLLEIIGSLTEIFHPANRKTRQKTINGVLEKIGVVSVVQCAFISRIDPVSKLVFTEFKWQAPETPATSQPIVTLPLESIQPVFSQLQDGITYTVEDFSRIQRSESELWKKWFPNFPSPGSIACELIYREHHPVGVIGLIRNEKGAWSPDTIMLMQLAAQLVSETLPKALSGYSILRHPDPSAQEADIDDISVYSDEINAFEEIEAIIDDHDIFEPVDHLEERMFVEPYPEGTPDNAQRVFATDDGVYALQCPKCERTEMIEADYFESSGWLLKVTCPCGCSFRIIREMRKVYRKPVHLSGSFGQDASNLNNFDDTERWSSMVVTNISKQGLNFQTPITRVLQVGDNIQLRFHLDNSSRSLINKSAIIKSVRKNDVGCQFQNKDKHDTTLGFYFL